MTDCLKSEKCTSEEVRGYYDGYISGIKAYVPEETKWLEMEQKYLNRWDFKLFSPWYLKQAGEYQWKMYEGYRDDAKYMLETNDEGGVSEEVKTKFDEARERRNEYTEKYYDFFDKASALNDWRKFFSHVPIPEGCTQENLTIPNTSGVLDTATPSGTIVPIDSNLVS